MKRIKNSKIYAPKPTGYAPLVIRACGFTNRLKAVLLVALLLAVTFPTTTFAQQSSGHAPLTQTQLRRAVIDLSDELVDAREKLAAADTAIKALQASDNASVAERDAAVRERAAAERVIAAVEREKAAAERELSAVTELANNAVKRADKAETEVTRQKSKVGFWKKVAAVGTAAGVVAGVLLAGR